MNSETKICKHCSIEFTYQRTRKARKFCSKKCGKEFHAALNRNPAKAAKYNRDNPAKIHFLRTKHSAKRRKLSFSLTESWFESRLKNGHCELTGLPIQIKPYQPNDQGNRTFYSPSIDRIDNREGYTPSNCRIVCWGANQLKSKFADRDINALALGITLRNLPRSCQGELLNLMPPNFITALPHNHPFPMTAEQYK
ncbi:MAG: hypothetical protein methR_P0585 [Methyloprofundus sp.]|nr:MAG: hypothetical protein methR_P0585 [Methyloprofundus sp.]